MLALGIILVLLAVGAFLAALVGGSDERAFFDLGVFSVETNTLGVFLIGAATVLLLVVGLELVRVGARRANRHRREKKELGRLQGELASRERGSRDDTAADATDTAADDRSHRGGTSTTSTGTGPATPAPGAASDEAGANGPATLEEPTRPDRPTTL